MANANEILGDVEAALHEVESEELAPITGAAEEAIRSARAGAPGPAQNHVASALGHVAHGYFGYENLGPVRERFAGLMLLAGLARELQRQERRIEARQLEAA